MIFAKPSLQLITKDQLKFINSLQFDKNNIGEFLDKLGIGWYSTDDKTTGGYYDLEYKELIISEVDEKHFNTILCHEFSHYIQSQTIDYNNKLFSTMIEYEQQAESISQLILLPRFFQEKGSYLSYFSKKDFEWLKLHCQYFFEKGYVQDNYEEIEMQDNFKMLH